MNFALSTTAPKISTRRFPRQGSCCISLYAKTVGQLNLAASIRRDRRRHHVFSGWRRCNVHRPPLRDRCSGPRSASRLVIPLWAFNQTFAWVALGGLRNAVRGAGSMGHHTRPPQRRSRQRCARHRSPGFAHQIGNLISHFRRPRRSSRRSPPPNSELLAGVGFTACTVMSPRRLVCASRRHRLLAARFPRPVPEHRERIAFASLFNSSEFAEGPHSPAPGSSLSRETHRIR